MTNLVLRPQPLGIFPLPASYLVLPADDEAVAVVRDTLLRGHIPTAFPSALRFYELALHGAINAAWDAVDPAPPEGCYNRFVLRSDPEQYTALRETFTGDLALLLDIVAYTLGYIDTPPDASAADDELHGFALMVQAAHEIEHGQLASAEVTLKTAVDSVRTVSPLLAAQLLGTLAETQQNQRGPDALSMQHYREALRLLDNAELPAIRAQFALNMGIAYHELAQGQRSALLEAVKQYQEALRFFTRETHPELYALAQNNLALAYLSMPLTEASDQLRMGIAVQALRECLRIYTPETHPERWSSTQLNLANALQYLPSTHPQENLSEAVELYEELLASRNRVDDPLGYARLLANQGNALAHLGIFVHAKPKLQTAANIFTSYGEADAAASIRAVLDQIESGEQTETPNDGTLSTPTV